MSPLPSDDARWFVAEVQPHETVRRAWLQARFASLRDIDDVVQENLQPGAAAAGRDPVRTHAAKPLLFTTAHKISGLTRPSKHSSSSAQSSARCGPSA